MNRAIYTKNKAIVVSNAMHAATAFVSESRLI